MRRWGWIALALVFSGLAGAPPAQAEKRIALLIGNKDYKAGVGALANPLNDVRVVGDALRAVGFEVLRPVHNARRADMLLAVHDFAANLKAAGPDAVGFLYYSGHGIASAGENYLIPVDVDEPSTRLLSVAGVKQSEVLAILRAEAPNAAHYLVLDACRNTLQGTRGGKGFVPVGQQSGVLVAFAAEPGKTASDMGQGSGPYAAALAAELVKPGQNDLLMFHRVRVAVMDKTNGDQVPWTEDGIQRRERVVFGGEHRTAPIAAQPQVSDAERHWEKVKGSNSIGALEAFIRRYGDTFHGDLARVQLEELKKKQQVAVAAPPRAHATCDAVETLADNEQRCLKPGDTFKACSECPEMVVVPAGEFMMGSPASEEGRSDNEGPQHRVTIAKPFAVGKFEVTFAQWDACVTAGSCKHKPEDQGWGRGRRPAINVSWNDITNEYLPWLSRKTNTAYRLLTEAEWEYAARAGTTTRYAFGNTITKSQAQYSEGSYGSAGKTAEVGSFQPNAFGLHDMHGNVWEWVEDCWHGSYQGAPTDGSAWTMACSENRRVLRGSSWNSNPQDLRSANRSRNFPDNRNISLNHYGFRLARTLGP